MKNCNQHPKYKVILPPRTLCNSCWVMYKEKHGLEKTLKVYYSFVGRMVQEDRTNTKKFEDLQKLME